MKCDRLAAEPDVVSFKMRMTVTRRSCIEKLAEGWNIVTDLCGPCTQAFMEALDRVAEPVTLQWHPDYIKRAAGSRKGMTS